MYSLKCLSQRELASYEALCFPYFRLMLKASAPGCGLLAVGASLLGEPIGLLLAQQDPGTSHSAVIHSVVVASRHRRIGVATALLARAERELESRAAQSAQITFMNDRPFTRALEGLLAKRQWHRSQLTALFCEADFGTLSQAPWVQRRWDFLPEFEIVQWGDVTPQDRAEALQRQRHSRWFPEALNPFTEEHLTDPRLSLGLRHRGQLVGWCIVRELANRILRVVSLFVNRELQGSGRSVALLAEAIKRSGRSEMDRILFDVCSEREQMVKFVHRRMAPHLKSIRSASTSRKSLNINQQLEGSVHAALQ